MSLRVLVSSLAVQLLFCSAAAAQSPDPRDQPKLPPAEAADPSKTTTPPPPASTIPPPAATTAPTPATLPPPTPTTVQPSTTATPPVTVTNTPPGATPPATPGIGPPPPTPPGALPIPPPPAPATTPAPVPTPAPAAGGTPGETGYQSRLRGLEEKVNELKEKVFSSKARLVLLQEAVLHGSVTGAYALLVHKNTMGSAYKLEYASYHLDGQPIYQPADTAELEKKGEFPIFNGAIVPGSHTVSVYLVYRGASNVFAYWQGYQFKIKSSFTFHFEEGKITNIKVVGYEKGGVTVDMKDRPAVRFDVDVQKVTKSSAQGLGPQAVPPTNPEVK